MDKILIKKYIPMTETTYYTLLSVTTPRHGYAIMQYVNELTEGRITLGTGTLYTMVGRLTADNIIMIVSGYTRKVYHITNTGMELLRMETERLRMQLTDGRKVLALENGKSFIMPEQYVDLPNGGGAYKESGMDI